MAQLGHNYRKTIVAFKSAKFLVGAGHVKYFTRVEDVPGYQSLADQGLVGVINFLHKNLDNYHLCLQAADLKVANNFVYNDNRQLIAADGWKVTQTLGQGKDGVTVLGHRYGDSQQRIKTVKFLSSYGTKYLNHTRLFVEMIKKAKNRPKNFFKLHVEAEHTYYDSASPLVEVDSVDFVKVLAELCQINYWCIKNTGFVFWDFGFRNGKNYMINDKNVLKWIDYGGAGLLRCPNFSGIYNSRSDLPAVELQEPFNEKESLIIADSRFVKCQFLLHLEYWLSNCTNNADVWSSMLQIRRSMIDEIDGVLGAVLQQDLARRICSDFSNHDWTDEITWKQLGKYINANT